MLEEKVLESQPTWWKDIDPNKQYLVLGDDLDSLLSCCFLQRKFKGLEIAGFYDFKRGLYLNKELSRDKEPIYVDCSMLKYKCFDNHKTYFCDENPEMVNPNKGRAERYYLKYNGSTLAFLLALYNQDMSIYDETHLQRLLCIDSFYKGVYKNGGRFAHINYQWFERLGMFDIFKPLTDKLSMADFNNMIDDETLSRHFEVNEDGYIIIADHKDSQMEQLPKHKFVISMPVKQDRTDANCSESRIKKLVQERSIVSLSQTYEGTYQYSYLDY